MGVGIKAFKDVHDLPRHNRNTVKITQSAHGTDLNVKL